MKSKEFLPQALDSEQVIIGAVLSEGRDAIKRVAHIVTHRDFYDKKNSVVFRAMEYLYKEQQDIDIVTVSEFLQLKGYLDVVGGASALVDLGNSYVSSAHIVTHARVVADRSVLRRIIEASQKIIDRAYSEDDLDKFLIEAETELKGVTRSSARAENKLAVVDLVEWRRIARETETPPGTVRGLSSGYRALDELTEGFEGGEMYILTGHTGQGKSQLATNWAINVAKRNHTVLFINTEMTKIQMGRRVNFILGEEGLEGKIIINDRSDIEHRDVIAIMENAKEKGCDMVVVDHLHYFVRSIEHTTAEVSRMTKDFKDAAVNLDIPLLLLCHVDQSKPPTVRPTLKMLKNSSSIAQDSDIVLTIFRDEDKNPGVLELIRLKGRSTAGNKKYGELYYDGLKLTEQKANKTEVIFQDYHEPKERDETDLSVPGWAGDTSTTPIVSTN